MATVPLVAGGCPDCFCDPTLCATDDTGGHCAETNCGACLHGCPEDQHNMLTRAPVTPHTTEEPVTLTHDLIDQGFTEIGAWPDGDSQRLKPQGREALGALLGETIPDEPIAKADVLALLDRARKALPR